MQEPLTHDDPDTQASPAATSHALPRLPLGAHTSYVPTPTSVTSLHVEPGSVHGPASVQSG